MKLFGNKKEIWEFSAIEISKFIRSGQISCLDTCTAFINRIKMIDKKTKKRVTKIVVDNFPEVEDEKFIFGTDNPKTVVAIQDFNDSHFDFDNETNTLTIETEFVFTKKSQIDGSKYEPFFVIMQHINQPYGLDFRILPAYKANLTSAGREIDYKQVD